MNRLTARLLFDGRRFVERVELRWQTGGPIASMRRLRASERCQDQLVLPGLVNAHAHLQLPALPRPARRFLPWVGQVLSARAHGGMAGAAALVRQGIEELLADGCTAVGEIDSLGCSPAVMARAGIAGCCYQELTGFDLQSAAAANGAIRARRQAAQGNCAAGLSPHAPYSASAALIRQALRATSRVAIHAAELPEEQEFLRTGKGPFRDLLERLGRLPTGFLPPGCGAVAWLQQLGALRPGTLLVHCQELERGDARRIAAAGASVVVCPGTIAHFRRRPPPVRRWLELGIPVALGTDSRASNTALSMRLELQRASRLWPELGPVELFAMASAAGGAALRSPGLGRLRRGGRADLLTAPLQSAEPSREMAAFVAGRTPLTAVVVGGRRVRQQPA